MNWNDFKNKLLRAPDGTAPGGVPDPAATTPPAADTPAPAPQQTPPGPDLDWLPEAYRKDGQPDLDGFRTHYEELAARAAAVPADPNGYDLTPPEGFALAADDPDMAPLLTDLRAALHEMGAPADSGAKVLGLLARYEDAQIAKFEAQQKAETARILGPSAQTRIADLKRTLETRLPADMAAGLQSAIKSPVAVQALEKLLASPGLQTPAPSPNAPDLENLTPLERLRIANAQPPRRG